MYVNCVRAPVECYNGVYSDFYDCLKYLIIGNLCSSLFVYICLSCSYYLLILTNKRLQNL